MILPPVYIAILCASLCCVSDDMRLCETVDEMVACRFLCNFQFLDSLAADELVDGLFINTWIVQRYSSSAPEPISMLHLSCRFQSSRGFRAKS